MARQRRELDVHERYETAGWIDSGYLGVLLCTADKDEADAHPFVGEALQLVQTFPRQLLNPSPLKLGNADEGIAQGGGYFVFHRIYLFCTRLAQGGGAGGVLCLPLQLVNPPGG